MGDIQLRGSDIAGAGLIGATTDPTSLTGWRTVTKPFWKVADLPEHVLTQMTARGHFPGRLFLFHTLFPDVEVADHKHHDLVTGWLIGDDRATFLELRKASGGQWTCSGEVRTFAQPTVAKRAVIAHDDAPVHAGAAGKAASSAIDFMQADVLPASVRRQLAALFPWTRFHAEIVQVGMDEDYEGSYEVGYTVDCIAEGRGQVLAIHAQRRATPPRGASTKALAKLISQTPWTVRAVHGVLS